MFDDEKMDDFVSGLMEMEDEEELPSEFRENPSKSILQGYNISLLLDTSYSMKGQKMEDAKNALNKFVEGIDINQNEIALVSFGDGVQIYDDFSGDINQLKDRINKCEPAGATPMLKAIENAYEAFLGGKDNPVMVLATDGIPTDATRETIIEYAHEYKNINNVWIITVGIGHNVDSSFLENLATSPDYYFFAELSGDLVGIYEEILEELPCGPH